MDDKKLTKKEMIAWLNTTSARYRIGYLKNRTKAEVKELYDEAKLLFSK